MEANSPGSSRKVFIQLLCLVPLVILIVLYWGQAALLEWEGLFGYGEVQDYGLPEGVMEQFRLFDSNADGCIDPYEFSSLKHHLGMESIQNLDFNYTSYEFIDEEIDDGKEVVFIEAVMEPLVISSMAKFSKGQEYVFGSVEKLLPGLLAWKEVHIHSQMYGARNFKIFFPPHDWPVGKPYYIIKDKGDFTSMNRYHPPKPTADKAFLHAILAQFHPNVFVITRFGPKGTVGIVRGRSQATIDIVFRVHAEYQLNVVPNHPFWFTPAQFVGHLIADIECNHIYHFELKLPVDKQLNIDMEWIIGEGSNEVDIGYVPLMKLFSSSSLLWEPAVEQLGDVYDYSNMTWEEEIDYSTSTKKIERFFYPFKQVNYFSFLEAVSLAFQEHKLIHLIILWGALDDQSC